LFQQLDQDLLRSQSTHFGKDTICCSVKGPFGLVDRAFELVGAHNMYTKIADFINPGKFSTIHFCPYPLEDWFLPRRKTELYTMTLSSLLMFMLITLSKRMLIVLIMLIALIMLIVLIMLIILFARSFVCRQRALERVCCSVFAH